MGVLSLTLCGSVLGNDAQAIVCGAGINLGQAEMRTYLFGRALGGEIPANQAGFISTNLANAAADITAAEELFGAPFSTEPGRKQAVAQLLRAIGGYAAATSGDSYTHRAAAIQTLAGQYLATLQATFVSSRSDALQYNETCDSLLLNACYFYGKAMIASEFDDQRAAALESGAVGTFKGSIRDGLAIAMDADGHTPPDGHARKICCTIGTPDDWKAMDSLQTHNPPEKYAELQTVLLGIIAAADTLDPVCLGDRALLCGSSPNKGGERQTGVGNGVAGEWSCSAHRGDSPLASFVLPHVFIEPDGRGGAAVAIKEYLPPVRRGDPVEERVTRAAASLSGGNLRWKYTRGSSPWWTDYTVNLDIAPDGRTMTGTVRETSHDSTAGTSETTTHDVTCVRPSPTHTH